MDRQYPHPEVCLYCLKFSKAQKPSHLFLLLSFFLPGVFLLVKGAILKMFSLIPRLSNTLWMLWVANIATASFSDASFDDMGIRLNNKLCCILWL